MTEQDVAPAGGARNPAPGRPRVAVRAHYGALPSMAGRGFGEGGRKPAGGRVPKGPAADRPPEVRPRGQKSPPWSAAGRRPSPIARRGRAARRIVWALRGAPFPRHVRGEEGKGRRDPRRKEQGQRSVGCLTIENERGAERHARFLSLPERRGGARKAPPGLAPLRLPFSAPAVISQPERGPRHPWRLAAYQGRPASAAFFH